MTAFRFALIIALLTGFHGTSSTAAAQQAAASTTATTTSRSSGVRLGIQARLDALSLVGGAGVLGTGAVGQLAPYVAPGVRLVDGKLYLGLGIGLAGFSDSDCNDTDCDNETNTSRIAWTLSPLVNFDLLQNDTGALYLLGWINLGSVSDVTTTITTPVGTMENTPNNGSFGWGINVGAGLRGQIVEALAIGTEFGWGFLHNIEDGDGDSIFLHGFFGTIMIEASVGL